MEAEPDDFLMRRGTSWESARRLAAQAAQAGTAVSGVPVGHGVSVTSPMSNQRLACDPGDAVQVTRKTLEDAGFEVRTLPGRAKPDGRKKRKRSLERVSR